LKEHAASIFRVEEEAKQIEATCFMIVSCMAYSSTLKMEATCPFKT
jgi:hypothetical protein